MEQGRCQNGIAIKLERNQLILQDILKERLIDARDGVSRGFVTVTIKHQCVVTMMMGALS